MSHLPLDMGDHIPIVSIFDAPQGDPRIIATDSADNVHHLVVVLRDDQLDLIADRVIQKLTSKGDRSAGLNP